MRFHDALKDGRLQLVMGESCLDQACVRQGSAYVFNGAHNCVICRGRFSDKLESQTAKLPYSDQCIIAAFFRQAIHNRIHIVVPDGNWYFRVKVGSISIPSHQEILD